MSKKLLILASIIMIFVVVGCSQPEQSKTEETPKPAAEVNLSEVIFDQWKASGHAKVAEEIKDAPGMREQGKCFTCHNGYAFERKAANLEGIGILKGTSCDTCHIGNGAELMKTGSIELPFGNVKGGKGTLCIACHMGRGKAPDQKSSPHHSVQTDVLLGESGAAPEGVTFEKGVHATVNDSCLACHMAEDKDGVKDHTFKMNAENIKAACGSCHGDFKDFNPAAKADYDGDGNVEGIQDEVTGLQEVLKAAIDEKLAGGKFVSQSGQIVFNDAAGKVLEAPPSPEVYNAAWNHFLIDFDGSKGVHNPTFAVKLLQQSYKALTGQDVPKAKML